MSSAFSVRGLAACACVLFSCALANAEADEHVLGGSALITMPQFENEDATAFGVTTIGAQVSYQYGTTEDLYAVAQFSFWVIPNAATDYSHYDTATQRAYDGSLNFNGEGYHGEVGCRYKLYSGYNVAPYIEVYGGYLWSTFRDPNLRNENNISFDFDMTSFGRGAFTAGGALGFDVRLWNVLLAGASVKYTMALDDVVKGAVSIPVTMSYYW